MTTTPPNDSQLDIEIVPSGDRAVTVYLGNSIDPQTSQRVLSLVKNLDKKLKCFHKFFFLLQFLGKKV